MGKSTHKRRALPRAVFAITGVVLLQAGACAAGSGTFDPYPRDAGGPQLVTFVDTDAAPARCVALAGQTRDYLLMLAGLVAPIVACSAYSADRQRCTIVAPISGGVGKLLAAVAALSEPDEVLGHEFRHCSDHDFHPALLPFMDLAP